MTSEKQEVGARTIRKKVHTHLPRYLANMPPPLAPNDMEFIPRYQSSRMISEVDDGEKRSISLPLSLSFALSVVCLSCFISVSRSLSIYLLPAYLVSSLCRALSLHLLSAYLVVSLLLSLYLLPAYLVSLCRALALSICYLPILLIISFSMSLLSLSV